MSEVLNVPKKKIVKKIKPVIEKDIEKDIEPVIEKIEKEKPKRKRQSKKEVEYNKVVKPYISNLTKEQINDILKNKVVPLYKLDIKPQKWVMPNRAKYVNWVDRVFKEKSVYGKEIKKVSEADCTVKADSLTLFPHQKFIKDYMQFMSPYRGLLLYHGVGVGKSCTSIAAAEILVNHMDVIVMIPASLRDNYVNEVKKCGLQFYALNQHWVFVPEENLDAEILNNLKVSKETFTQQKGLWIPLPNKDANYNSLSQEAKEMIASQIDETIKQRFTFINYNGLQRKNIDEMINKVGGSNPFDNKCVIVDEIHNLISVITNGGLIGSALYKLLMQARNMKIILLSGTPIINYPYEIAYLLNLITGPRQLYDIKATKESQFNVDEIKQVLNENRYVDSYEIDLNSKKITISFLPEGFAKESTEDNYIRRESHAMTNKDKYSFVEDTERIKFLIEEFKNMGIKVNNKTSSKIITTLPEKEEDFNQYFVDEENIEVTNKIMFMRRILGTVSYYSTYSPELYPSVNITEIPLEMNDYQFNMYEEARGKERKKEKNSKFKSKGKDSLFKSTGQVYRFYSRALCNFVFPQEIERVFPSKLSQMKKEIDDIEDSLDGLLNDTNAKSNVKDEEDLNKKYLMLINKALKDLEDSGSLDISEIEKYSPKFKYIYDKISVQNGCSLIYSQFRKVEGLGLFSSFLKVNGYAEFKIKKVGEEWDIDIDEGDYDKPKYISFTGSNEEARILLKIFNSDLSEVPVKIKEKLPLLGGTKNYRGEIIKVIMITKSGSEGISLKNVREVHIMEPYWNSIRTDQVVGRAVRTCSHIDLPKKDRHVQVYVYYMRLSEKQKQQSFSIRTQDKSMTSDEYIFDMAKKKAKIINGFLDLMKMASVDCGINAGKHGNLRCFSFPVNIDDNKNIFVPNIASDTQDSQYLAEIEKNEWRGEVLVTKKGRFLIRRETNEVYDYDAYIESGKLIKLGVLHNGNKIISN